ncbi:hypothetical protein ACEN2P_08175 [Pedobacter psychrotolerans]|uniref:hypothetical protein n=1 Tax=Pedobacter psychrotolerans TaxID=1843235 RepID=UPI003F964067
MYNFNQSSFAIIGYDSLEEPFTNIGTAFFINAKGNFITAGHTFKNQNRIYFAVLNEKRYPIEIIYNEYEFMENQKAPYHKDLIIGLVIGVTGNSYYSLADKNGVKKSEIMAIGFSRTQYGEVCSQLDSPNGISTDCNDGNSQITDGIGTKSPDLGLIRFSKLEANYNRAGLDRIYIIAPREVLINGFRFDLEIDGLDPAGLSGGPILENGNVIGMLISKDAAISSTYIMECLSTNDIQFTKN